MENADNAAHPQAELTQDEWVARYVKHLMVRTGWKESECRVAAQASWEEHDPGEDLTPEDYADIDYDEHVSGAGWEA